jgi:hypothetical protein
LKFLQGLREGKVLEVTPFHNDLHLQRFVKGAIGTGLEAFIETGTFRGDSLRWIAKEFPNLPCLSCESSRIFYAWARARVKGKNTRIYLADSRRFLAECVGSYGSGLFWLDAHWGENWPILDEMKIIMKSGVKGVVLIDDFDVGRDGFGFDSFHNQPLDFEYISPLVRQIYVPRYQPSKDYRGYAVIPLGMDVPASLLSSYETVSETGAT